MVGVRFGPELGRQPQQQLFGVELLAPQVARPGAQRGEHLTTVGGRRLGEDDRRAGRHPIIGAQQPAQVQAVAARQVDGEDDGVGLARLDLPQEARRGVRLQDAVAARDEHRLERPGKPLLGIGDHDQRGTGCGSRARHGGKPSARHGRTAFRTDDRRRSRRKRAEPALATVQYVQSACTEGYPSQLVGPERLLLGTRVPPGAKSRENAHKL